jgi:hypothetical protein
VVPGVVGSATVHSVGDVYCCVGSSSLESSDCGWGAVSSSSEDSGTCSLSKGRVSPSNSCMSGHAIPRYGFLVTLSCSSLCH